LALNRLPAARITALGELLMRTNEAGRFTEAVGRFGRLAQCRAFLRQRRHDRREQA